jgi:hypothetical protein
MSERREIIWMRVAAVRFRMPLLACLLDVTLRLELPYTHIRARTLENDDVVPTQMEKQTRERASAEEVQINF